MLRILFVGVVGCVFANYARRQHSLSILHYECWLLLLLFIMLLLLLLCHTQTEANKQNERANCKPKTTNRNNNNYVDVSVGSDVGDNSCPTDIFGSKTKILCVSGYSSFFSHSLFLFLLLFSCICICGLTVNILCYLHFFFTSPSRCLPHSDGLKLHPAKANKSAFPSFITHKITTHTHTQTHTKRVSMGRHKATTTIGKANKMAGKKKK